MMPSLHGYLLDDEVLRAVVKAIFIDARRANDVVARFGGEEFVMLLPHTDAGTAASLMEALQAFTAARTIRTHPGALLTVTRHCHCHCQHRGQHHGRRQAGNGP